MTLDKFIKQNPVHRLDSEWSKRLWQAAHVQGERVGWENGMREAIETLDQVRWGYDGDCGAREKLEGVIARSIDARKPK